MYSQIARMNQIYNFSNECKNIGFGIDDANHAFVYLIQIVQTPEYLSRNISQVPKLLDFSKKWQTIEKT